MSTPLFIISTILGLATGRNVTSKHRGYSYYVDDEKSSIKGPVVDDSSPTVVATQIVGLKVNQLFEFEINLEAGMQMNYCQGFIVFEEDFEIFLIAYQNVSPRIQQKFGSYHFVFVSKEISIVTQYLTSYRLFTDSPDILFIEMVTATVFNLWTTRFKGPSEGQLDIVLLDAFDGINRTFSMNSNLFPDKLINLMGRPLRTGVFTYKPYVVVKEPGSGEKSNVRIIENSTNQGTYLDGTEGQILLKFCEKFNCTLELFIDEEAEWGELFANYTGTGVFGSLVTRKVDIIIDALYLWYEEYLHFQFSTPLSRTGIACLVPKPKRIVSWFQPLQPFSFDLWMAILTVFLTPSISLGIAYFNHLTKFNAIVQSTLLIFQICLSQSVRILPRSLAERIFIFCCLLIGLIINDIYSSGLSSFLTVPIYEEAIDTKEQLAQKHLRWGATSDAWILSIVDSKDPVIQTIVENFQMLTKDELHRRALTEIFAISFERLPYGGYAAGDYVTSESMLRLQAMQHDIYYEYCVLMSFKSWPMIDMFDNFVLRVIQSGIQEVWEASVISKYLNLAVQQQINFGRGTKGNEPRSLAISDILGTLMILIFGISLSFIVFQVEIYLGRIGRNPKKKDIIEYFP